MNALHIYTSKSASATYRVARKHAAKTGQYVHRPAMMEPRPEDHAWFDCFGEDILIITWDRVRVAACDDDAERIIGYQWVTLYKLWSIHKTEKADDPRR